MNNNAFLFLEFWFILCCPTMSQYTELEELEALLATQELLAFESAVDYHEERNVTMINKLHGKQTSV